MPTISYKIKYKKNTGVIFSAGELFSLYLYGINIQANDGTELDNETTSFYIKSAQKEIENYLNIKLNPTLINESIGYYRDDYYAKYPIFQTKYPVKKAYTIIGLLNTTNQIVYPREWIKTHKDDPDNDYPKFVCLIPTGSATAVNGSSDVILSGIMTNIGLQRWNHIPEYWDIQYVTGYDHDKLPMDILNLIGKFASIGVLNILGDLIIGAGIANYSLSIDGLSKSVGTTQSAENSGLSARIRQYTKEITDTLKRIKMRYRGFNISVM